MTRRFFISRIWVLGCLGFVIGAASLAAAPTSKTVQGEASYDLREIGRALGMEVRWTAPGKALRLKSQWSELEFSRRDRFFVFNDVRVYLGRAVVDWKDTLWITKLDYERTIQPLLTPQAFARDVPGPVRRILLDPGHGGKDPGTMNPGLKLKEKSLTLDLSARVERLLKARGYEVVFTRRDDRYIGLRERSAMARKLHADLFLSLHFNSTGSSSVEGIETYAFTPRDQPSTSRSKLHSSDHRDYRGNDQDVWNALLGYHVQRALIGLPRAEDRGLKRARWDVLRDLTCPGILIESGFVSHAREGRDIGSAGYRQQLAEAIVAGVLAYEQRLSSLR